MSLSYQSADSFNQVFDRVRQALASAGFGVLTDIDVQATLKEKLGIDRSPYRILGICQPKLAHRALSADPRVGLLMPCNVIVYEQDGQVRVEATDPTALVAVDQFPEEVRIVAAEARVKLEAMIQILPKGERG